MPTALRSKGYCLPTASVSRKRPAPRDGPAMPAEVSKRWFRVPDTCGVEVGPEQDPVVILAVTVVLDAMAHPDR